MRTRLFCIMADVSEKAMRKQGGAFGEMLRADLLDEARKPQVGPRGGRYELVGDVEFIWTPDETIAAVFTARYVRPHP